MKSINFINKAASSIAALTVLAFSAPAAQSATLGPTNFDVNVDLSASCQLVAGPAPVLNFGVYTAFVGAATPAPTTSIGVECTRSLAAPTYSFDGATGYGVIAGLNYNVTAADAVVAGTAATAVLGGVGTADAYTVTLTGSMAGGQAGDCATGNAAACAGVQTQVRTLTITY